MITNTAVSNSCFESEREARGMKDIRTAQSKYQTKRRINKARVIQTAEPYKAWKASEDDKSATKLFSKHKMSFDNKEKLKIDKTYKYIILAGNNSEVVRR